jgi:ubiquitin carboxyl-terminal hydrolase 25
MLSLGFWCISSEAKLTFCSLFYGKLKWTYDDAKTQSKTESFNSVIVNVSDGPRDLYSALDTEFDIHKVALAGKKVARFGTIERMPPFLQVNIRRVGYDREKGAFKIENYLQAPETLYMDRYVGGNSKLLALRQKTWKWKAELQELEWRREQITKTHVKGVSTAEALDATWELVSKLSSGKEEGNEDLMDIDPLAIDPSLGDELQNRSKALTAELKNLDLRISGLKTSIQDQFHGMEDHGYRLHALFIHRGNASAGHYWIYIRDFKRDVWLKYNDEYVTQETDLDKIFKEDKDQLPATPYFLVYVRKGLEQELVDSLCRHLAGPAQDVDMGNTELELIEGVDADMPMS